MQKVLVTGGSGYIGSVVVRDLMSNGYEVVVFDDFVRGHRQNVPENVSLIVGDLCPRRAGRCCVH